MFDTHVHLNFKIFNNNLDQVIADAKAVGVNQIIVPGTDIESSKRAIEIANQHDGVYAAVGIHPHHVYDMIQIQDSKFKIQNDNVKFKIKSIEELIDNEQVIAAGEVGLDRHVYTKTKYQDYHLSGDFFKMQEVVFVEQLKLAIKYKKSIIIHNREATEDILQLIISNWSDWFLSHMVFHCCEPDKSLLEFAIKYNIYIGVDGDVTWQKPKQNFVKNIPLELLVLETDSPFLSPQITNSKKQFPNQPSNLPIIAEFIANLFGISIEELKRITTNNAKKLFNLNN